MAFTILHRVGEQNSHAVLATTILSYSLSSVLTGAVFYIMGKCKLGALIGFFPSHILMGCIGGVGWFLVATGLEVSARLEGNLEYSLTTLRKLFEVETIFLWIIPLVLAIVLLFVKRWVKHSLTDATYFLSIIAVFYFFVAAIPDLKLPELRAEGWVFDAPQAGVPFYHFYSLYGKLCRKIARQQLAHNSRFSGCRLESAGGYYTGNAGLDLFWGPSCAYKRPCLGLVSRRR